MKAYAQFYQMSSNWDGNHPSKPIEACGDRGVIILDGRETVSTWARLAREECRKRGYVGYEVRRAEGFNRPHTVAVPFNLLEHAS